MICPQNGCWGSAHQSYLQSRRWGRRTSSSTLPLPISHCELLNIHSPVPNLPIFSSTLNHPLRLWLESHLQKRLTLNPLRPIIRSIPPNIHRNLTDLSKFSNSAHTKIIISSDYPTHLLCFTEGSKSGPKIGYAFSSKASSPTIVLKTQL